MYSEIKLYLRQLSRLLIDSNCRYSYYLVFIVSHYSEEFIINEIGDRNMRASNLILYNVPESNSDNTADRIAHDSNVVSNLIDSIIIGDKNIKPVKLLRLGIRVHDKTRPIKAIFSSSIDVFEILKSKKKLLFNNVI